MEIKLPGKTQITREELTEKEKEEVIKIGEKYAYGTELYNAYVTKFLIERELALRGEKRFTPEEREQFRKFYTKYTDSGVKGFEIIALIYGILVAGPIGAMIGLVIMSAVSYWRTVVMGPPCDDEYFNKDYIVQEDEL